MTTSETHLIAAYVLSLTVLWGYAALLWFGWWKLARRERRASSRH